MDWSKTKTIFIVVFSILNVFLYSLYLNRHMEMQNVQVMGKTSIEEALKLDNITYDPLPPYKNDASYISAKVVTFDEEEVEELEGQSAVILGDTVLQSVLDKPETVRNSKGDFIFTEFLNKYVLHGAEYELWEVDEEEGTALFFQKAFGEPIYYSPHAMLMVYLNSDGKVISYEQRMSEEFVSYNRKKDLLSPIEAIGSLSNRGYIKPDSKVKRVTLGYSTLLTETLVFAPTWNVRVELKDGTIENHFINAIEGKVLEFQLDASDEEKE
ncbi:two-component system regulatory protein YycI [Sporosarcina sp. 179-K 3D1 HS]|uniref:two-component system regulatory protein YycI n=1 Tax=Sporosarcina sp. 179-K 3D1 HS TaxID=3232169 RepID=UPI00399F5683